MIGTKIDKPNRVIRKEEARQFAYDRGLLYIEINALTCDTMDMAMTQFVSTVLTEIGEADCPGIKRVVSHINIESAEESPNTKTCCSIM